jgi:YidC/Oxa1 family membrane protein insertase
MGIVDDLRVEADYDDLQDAPVKKTGSQGWIGMTSRYFMAALVPDQLTEQTFLWRYSKTGGRDFYTTIMQPESMDIDAGQTVAYGYTLYAGPKSATELEKVTGQVRKAIDYGWFDIIARPIYVMVMWFYGLVGNFGLAIIFATIVLKMITYPLAYKSYSAMAKMRKLQPRLTLLKERYADNKEQFAIEMMGLYKEHKVNPLSGCWPTFIQIPIFFAFYKVILISFEFRQAPLALWIEDMSVMDPYFVLPILMGLSMMLQMRLSPTSGDPTQQMMIKIMPIVFTFMFLWFPSGLVLYWLTNNVVSILQQLYVNKKLA